MQFSPTHSPTDSMSKTTLRSACSLSLHLHTSLYGAACLLLNSSPFCRSARGWPLGISCQWLPMARGMELCLVLSWEMLHANRALSQPLHLHSGQWTGLGSCHSFSVTRGKHEGRALPGLGVGCGQGIHLPSWQSPAKTCVRRDFL